MEQFKPKLAQLINPPFHCWRLKKTENYEKSSNDQPVKKEEEDRRRQKLLSFLLTLRLPVFCFVSPRSRRLTWTTNCGLLEPTNEIRNKPPQQNVKLFLEEKKPPQYYRYFREVTVCRLCEMKTDRAH